MVAARDVSMDDDPCGEEGRAWPVEGKIIAGQFNDPAGPAANSIQPPTIATGQGDIIDRFKTPSQDRYTDTGGTKSLEEDIIRHGMRRISLSWCSRWPNLSTASTQKLHMPVEVHMN